MHVLLGYDEFWQHQWGLILGGTLQKTLFIHLTPFLSQPAADVFTQEPPVFFREETKAMEFECMLE